MKSFFTAELDYLITRYLEKRCTEEEKNRLFKLLGDIHLDNLLRKELLSDINKDGDTVSENQLAELNELYNSIESEIEVRKIKERKSGILHGNVNIRRIIIGSLSAAAVILLAFFIGTLAGRTRQTDYAKVAAIKNSFVTIKAPLGSKSEIVLGDGSEVLLNAGSSVSYNNSYGLTNRDLILEGEAYFKVAGNAEIPLIVNAGNLNIRATGTEFNVRAYSEDGIIETTLIEGEVEISQKSDKNRENVLVLKPQQKAIYARQDEQFSIERKKEMEPQSMANAEKISGNMMVSLKTDVEQETAWTKNKLIIRSENLESLCTKLQRKYNVTFVFRDEEIKKHRFSGILLDETFNQVMDVIMLTAPVSYEMEGRTVYLFSRKLSDNNK